MRSNTLGKFTFKSVLARPFGVSGSKCHSARGGVHRRGPGAASAASASSAWARAACLRASQTSPQPWTSSDPSQQSQTPSPTRDAVLAVLRRAYAGPTAATARDYDVHVHVRGGDVFGVHEHAAEAADDGDVSPLLGDGQGSDPAPEPAQGPVCRVRAFYERLSLSLIHI